MGIMLVYDITRPSSFDNLAKWLRAILQHSNTDVEKMIVGNKCDMEDRRQIPKERGEGIAAENGIRFIETSAKDNINIEEAFTQLTQSILDKLPTTAQSIPQHAALPTPNKKEGQSCCST